MGERNWYRRYRDARTYADEQARRYQNGEDTNTYRGLTGATWVSEAYTIALENATSLMQVDGNQWQSVVDECKALSEKYKQLAS